MSYSFSVIAKDKADARAKASEKMDEVVAGQPVHAADREQAMAALEAFLEIVPEDPDKNYSVAMNGSVGWHGDDAARVITGAGVSISVHLTAKG